MLSSAVGGYSSNVKYIVRIKDDNFIKLDNFCYALYVVHKGNMIDQKTAL